MAAGGGHQLHGAQADGQALMAGVPFSPASHGADLLPWVRQIAQELQRARDSGFGASESAWRLLETLEASADASVSTAADLAGYAELLIVFASLAQSSNGDPKFEFSVDGGSNFLNVAFNRTQDSTSGQGRAAFVDGGRSTMDALQGSMHVVMPPAAYKHVTYSSNEAGASDHGLALTGTIESASEINLIRVSASAGNLTGTIQVFGRR
jgi:hypothetical protein